MLANMRSLDIYLFMYFIFYDLILRVFITILPDIVANANIQSARLSYLVYQPIYKFEYLHMIRTQHYIKTEIGNDRSKV